MKKISIIVLIMIMFYVVANMVWLKVVNNNIDEYLEEGTYDVANAFQFLDMVNSRLSETASLVMVKTMMIDRELEERKVS